MMTEIKHNPLYKMRIYESTAILTLAKNKQINGEEGTLSLAGEYQLINTEEMTELSNGHFATLL